MVRENLLDKYSRLYQPRSCFKQKGRLSPALLLALSMLLIAIFCISEVKADEVLLFSGGRLEGELSSSADGLVVKGRRGEKVLEWSDVDWIIMERKEFVLMSRILPEKTRYYADAFEQFMKSMADIFRFEPPRLKNWTIRIRIFRDRKKMEAYERDSTGEVSGGCGYFWIHHDYNVEELVITDLPREPDETFDTLLHEGTHLILYLWGKVKNFYFPTWIDEGMAEYYGGSSYDPLARSEDHVFVAGVLKPYRLFSIQDQLEEESATPLENLLVMEGDQFKLKHYGQAWSLIHFIAHKDDGKRAKLLYKFCHELRRTVREGDRARQLFTKTMRKKLPSFEDEWRCYVSTLQATNDKDRLSMAEALIRWQKPDEALAILSDLEGSEYEGCQAAVLQANALVWKGNYKDAVDILDWALEKQPDFLPAIRSRAIISYWRDDWKQGLSDFEVYLAQKPYDLDAGVKFISCLLEAPKTVRDPARAISFGEKLAEYHEDAELFCILGDAYMEADDVDGAVSYFKKALDRDPESADIQGKLEEARGRSGT